MREPTPFRHEFVRCMPEQLEDHTVYVSIELATAVHKCLCGCGQQVVRPLSPTDWQLIFDGETVSLYPSVGSWNLPCQSHYTLRRGKAVGMPRWSSRTIEEGWRKGRVDKDVYSVLLEEDFPATDDNKPDRK